MNSRISQFSLNHLMFPTPVIPALFQAPKLWQGWTRRQSQAKRADARLQHARVLVNCYAREVAMQEHNLAVLSVAHIRNAPAAMRQYRGQVLDIQLPRMHSRICVGVQHVSVTGNYDYTTEVYVKRAQAEWTIGDWETVAKLIIADLSLREGAPYNDDLQQQIEESIATMQHLFDVQQTHIAPTPKQTNTQHYIHSEQFLLTGHPFHPTPKSRSGWSLAEEKKYSPEHGAQVQLRYFQVPRAWIVCDGLDETSVDHISARLKKISHHTLQADEGAVILPLHPWQADWLLRQPRIQTAIKAGELRDLGASGLSFYPTASIRTMLAEDANAFLKLSLNLRITNCIRNNARHELAAAVTASRLYRSMTSDMQSLFPHFHVLEEQAYLSVCFPENRTQETRADKEIEDGFGMVLREGLSTQIAQGVTPMICASLFGNGEAGRLQVAMLIERFAHRNGLSLSQGMRLWFSRYAELAIFPVFYLLFEKGIAFEPHMQNSIVGLASDGAPEAFIVRDLELTRLTPRAHDLLTSMTLDETTRKDICCSDEAGWTRIGYCLLVNNICEVIATLANGNHERYLDLWACLRTTLQTYLANFPQLEAARRIQGLLSGEPLPVKGNLLVRFLKQADRKANYLPLYHPLGVVNGAHPLL